MLGIPDAKHIAEYAIRDPSSVSHALSSLKEFKRGRIHPDSEDFVWMVPQSHLGKSTPQPVAAVRISGKTMRIECPNRHTFRAMQILVDCIVGSELVPKSIVAQAT